MTYYTIIFHSAPFSIEYNGEKFTDHGMFTPHKFETQEEARSAIEKENTRDCIPGSEFSIIKHTYDDETEETERIHVETIPAIAQ